MKKKRILIPSLIIILLVIGFSINLRAQSRFGAGFNLGGGTIGGNLTAQSSFTSSLFIEGNPGFAGDVFMRLSFIYVSDVNILFPKSSGRYSPFIRGVSLKGIIEQNLSESIFLEEGLGILSANDRTFGNINEWDLGVAFSVLPGVDLRDKMKKGFKLGIGTEYGLTFTNSNIWYLSIHFQTEYCF